MTILTAPAPKLPAENGTIPPLYNGDRLSQPEFHRRYAATLPGFKAELIEGIVHVPSPLERHHGQGTIRLGGLLWMYEGSTPGAEALRNVSVILGPESESQPDLLMRLLPDQGGRVIETDQGILAGPPELIVEVAHSSEAIDLHGKRRDYQNGGVLEYLVLLIRDGSLRAFDLRSDKEIPVGSDGIYRSKVFPGLWIDVDAVIKGDVQRSQRTINRGLESPEHAAFVKKLTGGSKRSARK